MSAAKKLNIEDNSKLIDEIRKRMGQRAFKDEQRQLNTRLKNASSKEALEDLLEYLKTPKCDRFDHQFHKWAVKTIEDALPSQFRLPQYYSRIYDKYISIINQIDETKDKPQIAVFLRQSVNYAMMDQARSDDPLTRGGRSKIKADELDKRKNSVGNEQTYVPGCGRLNGQLSIRKTVDLVTVAENIDDTSLMDLPSHASPEKAFEDSKTKESVKDALNGAAEEMNETEMLLFAMVTTEGLTDGEMSCLSGIVNKRKEGTKKGSVNYLVKPVLAGVVEHLKKTLA